MTAGMSEEEIYEKAKKRVEDKRGFFVHFTVYIVVNIMLALIWAFVTKGFPWFLIVIGGWGIGVLMHFLSVFVFEKKTDSRAVDRAVEKEAEKLRKEQL